MSDCTLVALAASGAPAALPAESAALDYCASHEIDELLVIHVLETQLSKYGEIDQLADGSSKADFVNYIKQGARTNALALHDRITDGADGLKLQLRWLEAEGAPFSEISSIVASEGISLLFIGSGKPPASFFAPPKNLAENLAKSCSCRVITISYQE